VLTEKKLDDTGARLVHLEKSLKHLDQETGMLKPSARRATQFLKLKPYKTTVIHVLQLHNPTSRVHFYSWFLQSVSLPPMVFSQHVLLTLILMIFFFYGCLNNKVHNITPKTEELKENIYGKIENIPAEQLQRVNQSLFYWHEECLHVEGWHFQHHL
jgi:hypothetical protein